MMHSGDDPTLRILRRTVFRDDDNDNFAYPKFMSEKIGHRGTHYRIEDGNNSIIQMRGRGKTPDGEVGGYYGNVLQHEFGHHIDHTIRRKVIGESLSEDQIQAGTHRYWSAQHAKDVVVDSERWKKTKWRELDSAKEMRRLGVDADADDIAVFRALDDELDAMGAPRVIEDMFGSMPTGHRLLTGNIKVSPREVAMRFARGIREKDMIDLGWPLMDAMYDESHTMPLFVSDFLGSAVNRGGKFTMPNGKKQDIFWAHTRSYYRKSKTITRGEFGDVSDRNTTEMFANYFLARTSASPDAPAYVRLMRYMAPRTTAGFELGMKKLAMKLAKPDDPDLPKINLKPQDAPKPKPTALGTPEQRPKPRQVKPEPKPDSVKLKKPMSHTRAWRALDELDGGKEFILPDGRRVHYMRGGKDTQG